MHEERLPTIALLAGGLATRMRPATLAVAKSMLTVAGEPFLGHQLRMLAEQGFQNVVICSGHLEEQLREYAENGSRWGLSIRYSSDGAVRLGTGGAVRKALPLLGERFLVMYGDSYLPTDFRAVWRTFLHAGAQALMTVYRNEGRFDASNVHFINGAICAYSKEQRTEEMQHIDYGLSCFAREAFLPWSGSTCFDLSSVITYLLAQQQLAGFEVPDRFYEIGSAIGFADTDTLLRSRLVHGVAQQGRYA